MGNPLTETHTTSWGSRILGSFAGAVIGLVLFLGSFALLWWGEGRSIERSRTLDEGLAFVMPVAADRIDAANEGRLVHISGMAATEETLEDFIFGIEENALKLRRSVEMYQWDEESSTKTEENLGGSETTKTTYSYKKVWSDSIIDSSDFKQMEGHENPHSMPYESETLEASDIHIGEFSLTGAFTDQITDYTPYAVTDTHYEAMDAEAQEAFSLYQGKYFSGEDPATPQIGDVRVQFSIIRPQEISAVGKQAGNDLIPYTTKSGSIELLESGKADATAMFASAQDENTLLTWAIRLGGIVLMSLGMGMMLRPIRMIGAVVPFIGGLLGAGIGLIATVAALGLGTATIALAWLFYRPLIGISVLAISAALFFGGYRAMKKKLARANGSAAQLPEAA